MKEIRLTLFTPIAEADTDTGPLAVVIRAQP